jgi:uncharacterized protein YggE
MVKRLLPWLALSVLLVPAFADEIPEEPLIVSAGEGQVQAKPDALRFSVTTQATGSKAVLAQSAAQQRMKAIIAALRQARPGVKLQTQAIQVNPVMDYKSRPPKVLGYDAHASLEVTLESVPAEELGVVGGQLMDVALSQGADASGGLTFYVTNPGAYKHEALRKAVQAARQQAEVAAQAAGVTLTGLQSLEIRDTGVPAPMMMMRAAKADAGVEATQVETGESTITSQVLARFQFKNPEPPVATEQPVQPKKKH